MTSLTTAVSGLVKGKVQGVFLRAKAQQKARNLNLTGWIRNIDNGDVEILIAGNKLAVGLMEIWLNQGPGNSTVDSVDLETCEDPNLEDFEIRN